MLGAVGILVALGLLYLFASIKIVLEVAVTLGNRLIIQRRASEVGVENYAGRVDYASKRRPLQEL